MSGKKRKKSNEDGEYDEDYLLEVPEEDSIDKDDKISFLKVIYILKGFLHRKLTFDIL